MSHGEELFALGGDVTTEPSFESALRGYEKRQVDRYVARAEHEIATLTAEREQAYTQIHKLAGQVEHLQRDLAQVRKQAAVVDRASFKHLGPRVEQILALAEEQADAILAAANEEIDARRAAAEHIIDEARSRRPGH